MDLRQCTTFVIDRNQETFSYVFPTITIVRPIVRPEMVSRVAALLEYAGAEVKVIREEDEEKTMRVTKQLNTKNSEIEDRLTAVHEGRSKDVHGAALTRMDLDGLILWDEERGYCLTEDGRKVLGIVEFNGAAVVETPTLSENGARGAKAAAEVLEKMPATNGTRAEPINARRREVPGDDWVDVGSGFYLETQNWPVGECCNIWSQIEGTHEFGWYAAAPSTPDAMFIVDAIKAFEEEIVAGNESQQPFDRTPHFAIPIPSASEVKLRQSLYTTIRVALSNSTVFGHLLTPLNAIEDTDPVLDKWSGD